MIVLCVCVCFFPLPGVLAIVPTEICHRLSPNGLESSLTGEFSSSSLVQFSNVHSNLYCEEVVMGELVLIMLLFSSC
jgi:hypothetical protein